MKNALITTMGESEKFVIPEGLNSGTIENTSGTVTIRTAAASFGPTANDTISVGATSTWTAPEGLELGGYVIETGATSGADIKLFRVGGKPDSNEGRKA